MNFDNEKKQALGKIDKSKKQSVDDDIIGVVDEINSKDNFYTTSSCSGRIMVIESAKDSRKCDAEWLYSTHGKADIGKITEAVKGAKDDAWFKQEAAILHACCRTIEDANVLLNAARESGFKRSGMITRGKRIIVEIVSTEMMAAIVSREGNPVVDENYLKILAEEANSKMERNRKKIDDFFERIKKI